MLVQTVLRAKPTNTYQVHSKIDGSCNLQEQLRGGGLPRCQAIFVEMHDPSLQQEGDAMDPTQRVRVMQKMGTRQVGLPASACPHVYIAATIKQLL
eukprot:3619014-Amphidinium_carterae.1